MTTVRRTVALDAPPPRVFEFVTTPDNFRDYVAGYSGGEVTSDHPTGVDSAFAWTAAVGPLALDARERVTEWTPSRRVAYEGEMAGIGFRSSMDLRPGRAGGTELAVTIDYEVPGRRGGSAASAMIKPLISADVRRSLERLKTRFGAADDSPTTPELLGIYRKRAKRYDSSVRLYNLLGFRTERYRQLAVDALALSPGDTVVEIGCGTGANLALIQDKIGPTGTLIGVDLTDAMLTMARRRVREQGWDNVELVQSDATSFEFPKGIRGVLSTLALTHCPDYDVVIERGAKALAPGGRWVVLDLKLPTGWPQWMREVGLAVMRPFGVTLGAARRHPWESIERHLPHTRVSELYFGLAYLAVGTQALPVQASAPEGKSRQSQTT